MNDEDYMYIFCPGCGAELVDVSRDYKEPKTYYWSLECPNGCNLWDFWG